VLVDNRRKLMTFGQNCYGQLGLGDTSDRFEPEPVSGAISIVCSRGRLD
jgi:hypothetical protein